MNAIIPTYQVVSISELERWLALAKKSSKATHGAVRKHHTVIIVSHADPAHKSMSGHWQISSGRVRIRGGGLE